MIEANEELFNRWIKFGDWVKKLNGVVQNTMDISKDDTNWWIAQARKAKRDLDELITDTANHIQKDHNEQTSRRQG